MTIAEVEKLPNISKVLRAHLLQTVEELATAQILIKSLKQQLYGRKTEKASSLPVEQLRLFNEAEVFAGEEKSEAEEVVEVKVCKRKKRGRRAAAADIPEEIIVHDIPEDQKQCGCGACMNKIGEDRCSEIDYQPAQFKKITHIYLKYACKECEGSGDEERRPVVSAKREPSLIAKGMLTVYFIAVILIAKFCDALPFYRQEKIYKRQGIKLPRRTMCRYAMEIIRLHPLLREALHREALLGPRTNIDETTVQVIFEPGRDPTTKSYMWVLYGGLPGKPVVYYHYAPSRGADVAKFLLKGYHGCVQCDGYKGYEWLRIVEGIIIVSCMAHIRRKFVDVIKVLGQSQTAAEAITRIKDIYQKEKEAQEKGLKDEALVDWRREHIKPLLKSMIEWLNTLKDRVEPSGKLGEAVGYAVKYTPLILPYIECPYLSPDNNIVERAIRPFVIGRNNWKFFEIPQGAAASGVWYSLIETAKANGLEPYRYLVFLLKKLPYTKTLEDYIAILPHRLDRAEYERLSTKEN